MTIASYADTITQLRREIPNLEKDLAATQEAFEFASARLANARRALECLVQLEGGDAATPTPEAAPEAAEPRKRVYVKSDLLDAIYDALAQAHAKGEKLSAVEIHARLCAEPERLRNPNPARATVSQALSENKKRGWRLFGAGRLAKWGIDLEKGRRG